MKVLTGERRAVASAVLAFYAFLFLLVSMAMPPEWGKCFGALGLVYGLGFLGLVAGYFWGRWFAMGLGLSGLISAGISMWSLGAEPVLLFYGGTHAAIALSVWGRAMAGGYDGQSNWREKFHMNEASIERLGKSVVRLGISLPYILMYALAPKEGAALAFIAGAFAVAGTYAFFKMRTWGVIAMTASAGFLFASLADLQQAIIPMSSKVGLNASLTGLAALWFMTAAVAPYAKPVFQYLLKRD